MTPDLDALYSWMRERGVIRARVGDVELQLSEDTGSSSNIVDDTLLDEPVLTERGPGKTITSFYDDPDLYPDGVVPSLRRGSHAQPPTEEARSTNE